MPQTKGRSLCGALSVFLVTACSDGSDTPGAGVVPPVEPGSACTDILPGALRACAMAVSEQNRTCFVASGAGCGAEDTAIIGALDTLSAAIDKSCSDGDYGQLTTRDLGARLRVDCRSQADSIAWRSFGGPHGAAWQAADTAAAECLQESHRIASALFTDALGAVETCLTDSECDSAALRQHRTELAQAATAEVAAACPDLDDLVAVDPATFIANTDQQVDCSAAAALEPGHGLGLSCGPDHAPGPVPRAAWHTVTLDRETTGTLCGDGSDYAFHIRLAPEGSPLDRVIAALEGGGVCVFEEDCRDRMMSQPQLFRAGDESLSAGGLAGDDPDNPFADWTWVYFPYCNQDVFIGGGVREQFSDFSLPRYGAVNLRAGLRSARDIIWRALDAEPGPGYRPDRLIALFGGFSAGGYGTLYNYHYVLDDLQWPRTAAFPDAGGGLDNGGVGVRTLGFLKIPEWGARPYLPPYCFSGDCAVGPDNYRAFSPRLKQVPEQQYLILSNQKDLTQQRDAFFTEEDHWINAMRSAYCNTRDLAGIQWYLTGESQRSVHVVSIRDEFFYGEVAGERMVDWLWRAVTEPDGVGDRAEEGDFVSIIPGVEPFPCELP